ncbi:MAG: hypothetical protein H6978_14070 [Gammaproteobacteria bacterium]|nr:hypothetical protein [Gammaproteobacteria bacterium]
MIADQNSVAYRCESEQLLLVYTENALTVGREPAPAAASRAHRLEPVQDIPGAAAGSTPSVHYIVWTDVTPGWEPEVDRWYGTEHLPALAAVPGTVRARRFIQHGSGPRSYACYDLVSQDVVASAPWLQVRATDWSRRIRPQFINTRRWYTTPLAVPVAES